MVNIGKRSTFENLSQLKEAVRHFDIAEDRDVIIEGKGKTERFKALWNTDKNRLETIKSDEYVTIQHKEVFEPFIDTLSKLGLSVHGSIYDYGGAVYLTTYFKNMDLIPDDESGIRNGLRVINSFDGKTAIRGEMYTLRLVCSNGMKIRQLQRSVRQLHLGDFKTEELMESFVEQAINRSESLKILVSDAMKDKVEWELAKNVYEKLIATPRHREAILNLFKSRFEKGTKITRWDIYNQITEYATHGRGKLLSVSVEEYLQGKAEKLLARPIAKLVA